MKLWNDDLQPTGLTMWFIGVLVSESLDILVGGLEHVLFSIICGIILPID